MHPLRLFPLAALLLLPLTAHARFGKAGSPAHGSDSSASSSSSSSSSSDDSDSESDHHTHHARAANEPGPSHGPVYGSSYGDEGGGGWSGGWTPGWYAWGFGYTPLWEPSPSYGPSDYPETAQRPDVVGTFEFQAQAIVQDHSTPGGGAAGILLSVEGPQVGLMLATHSMVLTADDGSGTTDTIHLVDFHVSYALLTSPRGRLRIEGGLDGAIAPDIAFLGPGGGLSGVMGFLGPTSLEAALRVTPYPFTKVDWSFGLAVRTGGIGWQVGWRETYLDDQGRVDGVAHQDLLYGPYVGLALAM